ncbi:MAG: hypothetical protein ACRER2_13875 [Methylococcales bacterium]
MSHISFFNSIQRIEWAKTVGKVVMTVRPAFDQLFDKLRLCRFQGQQTENPQPLRAFGGQPFAAELFPQQEPLQIEFSAD